MAFASMNEVYDCIPAPPARPTVEAQRLPWDVSAEIVVIALT
jgi:hypothetical protein